MTAQLDITQMFTLSEAQAWLRDRVDDGEKCPCCTQFAKVYRRKIDSGMAHILVQMYRHQNDEDGRWVHVPSLGTAGGDPIKTRHWKLIEERQVQRDDGSSRAGWWRLTQLGQDFVCNRVRIPKHARLYDGRCLGLDSTETVSITDCLGTKFNYTELMNGV